MVDMDMSEAEPLKGILKPHAHDVLSGRGNFVNHHAGNENFRKLVKHHKKAYVACPKAQKAIYSKIIYDEIRAMNPSGRFLKQDPKTKLWGDIGEKKALDKTRQALREGAPELLKELESGMEVDETTSSAAHNNNNGGGGASNIAPQDFVAPLQRIPRNGHPLHESLLGNISLGSFSLGSQGMGNSFATNAMNNSFSANNNASSSSSSFGTSPVPSQVGANDVNSMFAAQGGAGSILAAAAQLQAAQQQQAVQHVTAAAQQQKQAEAQLQLLKAQMQMKSQQANSLAAAQQGAAMGAMGNIMANNAMVAAAAQAQGNLSGMGSGDMSTLLAAIHSGAAGMNAGMTNPAQQAAMAYQQQLAQVAMINQFQNSMNSDSENTLRTSHLNGSFGSAASMNNFGNGQANPFQQAALKQQQQSQQQAQEKSFNMSVPLKPPSDSTLDTLGDSGGGVPPRRHGANREGGSGMNSSFTRAQRIGLKNSFTTGRRPNRHLNNPEMAMVQQLGLKNSLMSIESLTLDDLESVDFGGGNMEGVFEDDESKGAESRGGGKTPSNKTVHAQGSHDVSELSMDRKEGYEM